MKTQLLNKNGILKHVGMLLIILLLSVCCGSEYLFAQSSGFEDQPIAYSLTIKEVTIVHYGFKMPERIVNTIKPIVDIDQLSSQLMISNAPDYRTLNLYAEKVDRKARKESRRKGKTRVISTPNENALVYDNTAVEQE